MGKSGISTGFAKCFILFMAVVILVQGAIYLGLSIWGITLRACDNQTTDIIKDPFKFAMDTIYFANQKCGVPQVDVGSYGEATLEVNWSKSYDITNREYIFFITYAAVSGLWVVTSFFIITTLCFSTTKVISALVYWPWFLLIIAGCVLDIVATVYHVIDITETTTLDQAFTYTGFSLQPSDASDNIMAFLRTFDAYFVTPAIVMTLISCRLVLIWLLNIFGSSFCLSLSCILANQQKPSKPQETSAAPVVQQQITPAQVVNASLPLPQPQQQQQQGNQYIVEYPEQIKPKPLPIMIPAATAPVQRQESSYNYQAAERNNLQSPVAILPPPSAQNDTTYRTTDAHPDQLNYPVQSTSPVLRQPTAPESRTSSPTTQLAVTSPLNNRYSESFPYSSPQQQHQQQHQQQQPNQRVSVELRGQLPWSYTSPVAKPPPPPRKPQVQIYPEIPEPDYADEH